VSDKRDWEWAVANLRSDDANAYVDACRLLNHLADESRLPALEALLDDDDFVVREAAVTPFTRIAGVRGLQRLLQVYDRGFAEGLDNDGPTADITGLVEMRAAEAAPVLLKMLSSGDNRDRSHAAWLLGYVEPLISPDPLLAALHDESPAVRGNAAGSLASFKTDERVLDALVVALADPDEQVRVDAAGALGYFGDSRALSALRATAHDPSERVRNFGAYAITLLEGQA
jgi:HEAT repeat protein